MGSSYRRGIPVEAIGFRSYVGGADNRRNGDGRRRKVRNTKRRTRYEELVPY